MWLYQHASRELMQFERLEFVFDSVYVDRKYNEISLTFTAGAVWCV